MLLVSAFNGLTQRVWAELRARGHHVAVKVFDDDTLVAVTAEQPDLVLCPYLKDRVPVQVWQQWPTVILHPGPVGDQGPSSLDRAITDGQAVWGVTALQAVEEFDAGPVLACHTFVMPADPPRKSALYGGAVTEAAVRCALEVVDLVADPAFRPTPLATADRPVAGTRRRPALTQADRRFVWDDDAADIVRRIRAADGFPGVLTTLADEDVYLYDAQPGAGGGVPGEILGRSRGHLLVAAGSGAVWVGQARRPGGVKLPAAAVLSVAHLRNREDGPRDIAYRRHGAVGEVAFSFYNGAAGVDQCRRLERALRHAAAQDTQVIVLRSGQEVFCNGIHLGEIEAASDPAMMAWNNIRAINAVCRTLIEIRHQITVAACAGPAGAGGVMLALGADVVLGRDGVMLNPHYDMGLFGSELHTLTLPHRVGRDGAATLTSGRRPISAARAADIGLIDLVGPRDPAEFDDWLAGMAARYADPAAWRGVIYSRLCADRPLEYYEHQELAEMARDIFDDRSGFAAARRAFLRRSRPDTALITADRTRYDEQLDAMALPSVWLAEERMCGL